MFVPLIITMCQSTLKHLFMRHFAFVPFYEFQMSIQITAMLDFGEVLITQRHEAKIKSLKI